MTRTLSPRGQPSAPPMESFRRWPPTFPPPSNVPTFNVPPFNYDIFRDRRREVPNLHGSKSSSRSSGSGESSMALSTMNAYSSPMRSLSHGSMYGPPGPPLYGSPVRTTVGPPLYMAGGGFDGLLPQINPGGIYTLPHYPPPPMRYFGRDAEDQEHTPWLSVVLAIIYTIIFILTMQHNNCPKNISGGKTCLLTFLRSFSFQPMTENPLLGPSAKTLLDMGALESELVTKAREGWRMVSSMWLHAGVFHISGNLLGLLSLGIPLERQLGYARVALTYMLSGFGGNILSALFLHGRISVGPSAAFMGLLGATLSSIIVNWSTHRHRTQTLLSIIFFTATNLMYGLMPLVDNFMHIGGAMVGFFFGNVLLVRPSFGWITSLCFPAVVYDTDDMPVKSKNTIFRNVVWTFSLCVVLAGFTMGLLALYQGTDVTKMCSWCHYLTCVPTHLWTCFGDRDLGCNPSSDHGYLRITCANNQTHDWPAVANFNKLTPQVQGLCIKSCVGY